MSHGSKLQNQSWRKIDVDWWLLFSILFPSPSSKTFEDHRAFATRYSVGRVNLLQGTPSEIASANASAKGRFFSTTVVGGTPGIVRAQPQILRHLWGWYNPVLNKKSILFKSVGVKPSASTRCGFGFLFQFRCTMALNGWGAAFFPHLRSIALPKRPLGVVWVCFGSRSI